jgi:hypothetical protein
MRWRRRTHSGHLIAPGKRQGTSKLISFGAVKSWLHYNSLYGVNDLGTINSEHFFASHVQFCSLSIVVWLRVAGIWLSREQVAQLSFAQDIDMHPLNCEE